MKLISTISILLAVMAAVSGVSLTNNKSNDKNDDLSKWTGKARKNCIKECFKDDTFDGDCNEKCDFTNKSKNFKLCIKDAVEKYQTNSKLCRQAKKQDDPLIITEEIIHRPASGYVTPGDVYRGDVTENITTGPVTKSYQFGTTYETCKKPVKDVFEIERSSCQSIHTHNLKSDKRRKLQSSEESTTMVLAQDELVRGFYAKTYDTPHVTPPSDTNVGISFCGAFPKDPSYPSCSDGPITNVANNWVSYGGGNDAGSWSDARIQSVIDFIPNIKSLGYTGVVLDIEQSSEEISISRWNELYSAIKNGNLILCVTTSHFKPYGISDANALVTDWLQNPLIDYLSPQLYTSGNEQANSWAAFNVAYKESKPKIIPSIVKSTYYATVPPTVTSHLPNAVGYIQWQNPQAPPPTPTGGCVSSTFSGVGCDDMCSWCQSALGTDQYYWETGVCTWDYTQCTGSPLAGVTYTCCQIG